jgi:sugar lactone lactonase YvrE
MIYRTNHFFLIDSAPSVLLGVTVAGYGNGTIGNDTFGLHSPSSVYVMSNGDLYVADMKNQRVQHYINGSRLGQTVAGIGTLGSGSNQLHQPIGIYVDASTYDVYVADSLNSRIQLWRVNATQGQTIIDTSFSPSPSYIAGIRRDAQGNFYVSDVFNCRAIRWPPNGTVGLIVAGNGSSGSGNQSLNFPLQIDLDANSEYMYIADMYNDRVQKWKVPYNGSTAATSGVTVAGGNGPGSGANQLNNPQSVCVSKKTGAVYIADMYNYRIQLWAVGATQGVTIAGNPGGPDITGPAQFNLPAGVILDPDENYLYVADQLNHRVQRFTLI